MITNKYFITTRKIPTYIKYLIAKRQSGGKLPEGYQELEYLESNGNQKIIIPYRANNKTKLYARYMQTGVGSSSASVVFGVTSSPATNNANNGIARLLPGRGLGTVNRVGWGGQIIGSVIDIGTAFMDLDTWYEIYFNLNKIYIDDTLVATSTQDPTQEWQAQYDFGIFIRGGSTHSLPFTGRISSLYCTENGRKTVNLIPALRKADSKPRNV